MTLKQISVFLENTKGRLAEVTDLLGREGINLRALTLADTKDFGILRLVVDDPEKALSLLGKAGFTAKVTEVIGIEVDDSPGGLAAVLNLLKAEEVNIEYIYSSLENSKKKAVIIFRIEDTEEGLKIIARKGIKTISHF